MRLRSKALAGLAGLALLGWWGADMWLGGDSPTGAQNAGSGAITTGPARSLQGTAPDGLQAVQTIVARGDAAYGINTGFGLLAKTRIPDEQLELLQRNLILSHSVGTGEALCDVVVRLIVLMKMGCT